MSGDPLGPDATYRVSEPSGNANAPPVKPAASFESENGRYTINAPADGTSLSLGRGKTEDTTGIHASTKTRVLIEATDTPWGFLRLGSPKPAYSEFRGGFFGYSDKDMRFVARNRIGITSREEFVSIRSQNGDVLLQSGAKKGEERPSKLELTPSGTVTTRVTKSISLLAVDPANPFSVTSRVDLMSEGKIQIAANSTIDTSTNIATTRAKKSISLLAADAENPLVNTRIDLMSEGKVQIAASSTVTISLPLFGAKIEVAPGMLQLTNATGSTVTFVGPAIFIKSEAIVNIEAPVFTHNGVPVKTV